MAEVYGIDLGTTFCACWRFDSDVGSPEPIDLERQVDGKGDRHTLASVIFLVEEAGGVVGTVGQRAEALAVTKKGVKIEHAKRTLGLTGPEARSWTIGDLQLDSVEASALILRQIRRMAVGDDGQQMRAVVTHPRDFTQNRKALTAEAVALAGIDLIETLDEPVAAAFAYFQPGETQEPGIYLVFDLGGGTLDVALLEVENGMNPKVIGGKGVPKCGGVDWDLEVVKVLHRQVDSQISAPTPATEYLTNGTRYEIQATARDKKHQLSKRVAQSRQKGLNCKLKDGDADGIPVSLILRADEFEAATAHHVEKCRDAVHEALRTAGGRALTPADISKVLPVGGSSRLLAIKRMLEELFPGKVADSSELPDPDQAIALGAARYAAYLDARAAPAAPGQAALLRLMVPSAVSTSLAHAINIKIGYNPEGKEQDWLHQVVRAGSPLPLVQPARLDLVVEKAGASLEVEIFDGPGGALHEGREPTLRLVFPPAVRAKAGDRLAVEIAVGPSGRMKVLASHADGTRVQAEQRIDGEDKDSRAKRQNNLRQITLL